MPKAEAVEHRRRHRIRQASRACSPDPSDSFHVPGWTLTPWPDNDAYPGHIGQRYSSISNRQPASPAVNRCRWSSCPVLRPKRSNSSTSSIEVTTVADVRSWRMALRRDCSFPLFVFGPVLLMALPRFAEICLSKAIVWSVDQLGSFGNLPERPRSGLPPIWPGNRQWGEYD